MLHTYICISMHIHVITVFHIIERIVCICTYIHSTMLMYTNVCVCVHIITCMCMCCVCAYLSWLSSFILCIVCRSTSHNICSVRFVVDRIKFRAMHYAVDNILLDCIFPTKINHQKSLTADQVSKV